VKYDSAHTEPFLQALKDGQGRVRACKLANIGYDAFLDWMAKYPEFSEAVKKAEAAGNDKLKDLQKRKILEDTSWQSGAWWLERNYPNEFRNRQEIEHGGVIVNLQRKEPDNE